LQSEINLKYLIHVGVSLFSTSLKNLYPPLWWRRRLRDGIRKRCGNECTTELRVREMEVGGRAVERNYGRERKTNAKKQT
jgi:hypothetical protein